MTKRVRIVRILLLAAAMLTAAFAWHRVSGWYGRMMQQRAQNEVAWSAPPMEAGAVFYLALDRPTGQNGALPVFGLCALPTSAGIVSSVPEDTISLEADGTPEAAAAEGSPRYVLFVPGSARATGLRVQFEGELLLDGQPLASGQRLELAEGEHRLETAAGEWEFTTVYGSELPCMFIETETGSLEAIHASKQYVEGAGFTLIQADGTVEHGGWIAGMHGRGNSTWGYSDKRPYQITLAERLPLAGMPAARRWALLANVYDPTLLCHQAVFGIAQAVGMAHTPETRQIELYINGEYRGCYLLAEKVEVDENRLNLPDTDVLNQAAVRRANTKWASQFAVGEEGVLEQPGYMRYTKLPAGLDPGAGGYLIELDFIYRVMESGNACYVTRGQKGIGLKCPERATEQQVRYIARLFQRLEDIALFPDSGVSGQPEELAEIVDLHSLVQKYLIDEIVKYNDANETSLYFYKFPDSIDTRLFVGPIWDYDTALGASGLLEEPEGFFVNQQTSSYPFWKGLYQRPDFQQEMRRSFAEEFVPVIGKMLEEGWIERQGEELAASACMDALRWQGGGSDPQVFLREYRRTYRQEVEGIAAFLAARMAWLQSQWPKEAAE